MRFLLTIATTAFAGCYANSPYMLYQMPLTSVERPADVSQRWGEYTITPADSSRYRYEDNLVRVLVLPARGSFLVEIDNKSEHSMQLVWDQAAYINASGYSSKVSNGETRVIDMANSQPPTVIPRAAKVLVTAIPNDNFVQSSYGNSVKDFVPLEGAPTDYEGKTFRLILPLAVQDVVNEYTFIFRLQDIRVPWTSADCNANKFRAGVCKQ